MVTGNVFGPKGPEGPEGGESGAGSGAVSEGVVKGNFPVLSIT